MKDGKTCKICSKTFTRRNYLQKHMENIHSKRYSCPTCLRYFAGPTEHSCATKNGRFQCYVDKCSLKFASGMSLRLHIRDGHKKVDENIASGDGLKTKKAARNMVKTLCRKINVLSKCFDELKYQVDYITEFLKLIGYESMPKATPKEVEKVAINAQSLQDDMDDYIVYDDEELIEEVMDNDEMNADVIDEFMMPKDLESDNQAITLFSKQTHSSALSSISDSPAELMPVEIPTTTLPESFVKSLPKVNLTSVTKVGSTIITKLPFKILSVKQKQNSKLNASEPIVTQLKTVESKRNLAEVEKDTPPLFLNIQYDNNETEISKSDPKITFHFDTRPHVEIDKNPYS